MFLFLAVFLGIYGGVNLYLYWKARQAFGLAGWPGAVLAAVLILMVLGPVLSAVLDRRGHAAAARPLAWVVYVWMAAAMWLFFLSLGRDLWNGLAALLARFLPAAAALAVPARGWAVLMAAVVMAAGLWGLREARDIRLTRVTIGAPGLPPEAPSLKVLHISDFHLGLLVGEASLARVIRLAKEAAPDILVSSGDLVDGTAIHFNHLAEMLETVKPPLGKWAVTGNHEYYAGLEEALAFHRAAGFSMLRGESVTPAPGFLLAGVDDPTGREMGLGPVARSAAVLPEGDGRGFRLLLHHRPEPEADAIGRFDLQLSGHTHRGQIYPFNYLVRLAHRYLAGQFDLGRGSRLYVSRGTGTWGPPVRLGSPPEVILYTIVPGGP